MRRRRSTTRACRNCSSCPAAAAAGTPPTIHQRSAAPQPCPSAGQARFVGHHPRSAVSRRRRSPHEAGPRLADSSYPASSKAEATSPHGGNGHGLGPVSANVLQSRCWLFSADTRLTRATSTSGATTTLHEDGADLAGLLSYLPTDWLRPFAQTGAPLQVQLGQSVDPAILRRRGRSVACHRWDPTGRRRLRPSHSSLVIRGKGLVCLNQASFLAERPIGCGAAGRPLRTQTTAGRRLQSGSQHHPHIFPLWIACQSRGEPSRSAARPSCVWPHQNQLPGPVNASLLPASQGPQLSASACQPQPRCSAGTLQAQAPPPLPTRTDLQRTGC